MTTTVKAIYEKGILRLPELLPLPEKASVVVTIQSPETSADADRAAWLKLSEEALTKTWENPGDDVFNELLHR